VVREQSHVETERRSTFHKILMKNIEMVTTYILDPINIVYNYAIYSMYFETLLDNGPNLSYKLEFQTITYNRFPWLRVTVRKLYYCEYMLHFEETMMVSIFY
jgi:hypothetical protein